MTRIPNLRTLFRLPASTERVAEEVRAELDFHLEMQARDLESQGLSPDEARAEAVRRFGNVSSAQTELGDIDRGRMHRVRRAEWWSTLAQDLRYAARGLRRSPLFALLAITTLALGIGANAAVFGVVKSVLLDALPYADADRIVRIFGRFRDGSIPQAPVSVATADNIATRQRSFGSVAAFMMNPADVAYSGDDGPHTVKAVWTQPALFQVLGTTAAVGRTLHEDDATSTTTSSAVVSYAVWQRLFGGDAGIVGRIVRVNGEATTVVGVLPRTFVGPAGETDLYFPLDLRPILQNAKQAREENWLGIVGRLAPGTTIEMAGRDLARIGDELSREFPKDVGYMTLSATSVRDALVGDTRTPLLLLMASASLVLLITCANLAGAALSRTISRQREFAVRVALGAGRTRLVRQLLTESVLLSLIGGAVGIALAAFALALLRGLAAPLLPSYTDLALDGGAMLVMFVASLATGVAFGLAPALSVSKANPQRTLRDEARGTSESPRSRTLRGALVGAQIALSISLMAGAGLLARSLWAMATEPLGFEPSGVLTANVQYQGQDYATPQARIRFQEQLEASLRQIPGVRGVALASAPPTAVQSHNGFTIEGSPWASSDATPFVLYASVSDDYFRTLGVALRRGRTFAATDRADAPPVAVISESMARQYWPKGDAVGSRIHMAPDMAAPIEVIGVVADVRNDPVRERPEPMIYGSARQRPWGSVSILIRAQGNPLPLAATARRQLAALDPTLPLDHVMSLQSLVGNKLDVRRLPVVLMTSFGIVALVLASVGVYGLFASMAAAREREFSVRVALGSSPTAIARLVIRQGMVWLTLGLAGGMVGVVVIGRFVAGLLYGVQPFDPLTLGATLATIVVCGMIALLAPIRRATRADATAVLR